MQLDDHARLRAYLLGRLSDDECGRIEEQYFSDDDWFECLTAGEDELIRDYLRGDLSEEDSRAVVARYTKTEQGRARIRFASDLLAAASAATPATLPVGGSARESHSFWSRIAPHKWSLVLAASVAALIGVVLRLDTQVRRMSIELSELRAASPKHPPASPVVLSFLLEADISRDTQSRPKVLLIPPQAAGPLQVRFRLDLEPGQRAGRYRAACTVRPGGEVWSGIVLRAPNDDSVEVALSAESLPSGDFTLSLDQDPPGQAHEVYAFRLLRQP